ncbi:hypothetical protein CDAR_235211 [Caerostris darwini]|uniref:Uncharacterized protein n=1 Tax=Caerostris darwini TaxID=1538125 RepID=A0AAV4MPW9_9ARAC|nr:hypothetical protein CDAR_235211 [Caerostris darwini]
MPNNSIEETPEASNLQELVPPMMGALSSLLSATERFSDALFQRADALSEKATKIKDMAVKRSFTETSDNLREISTALVSFSATSTLASTQIQTILDDEEGFESKFSGVVGEVRDMAKQIGAVAASIRLVSLSIQQISETLQEDEMMSAAGLEVDEMVDSADHMDYEEFQNDGGLN